MGELLDLVRSSFYLPNPATGGARTDGCIESAGVLGWLSLCISHTFPLFLWSIIDFRV
jgi:hypothetical protein